ncbi:MAG TPA: ATP-binding protein [Bauldia sp.]|nr:ATP-binding protein [Bauldia sp.]
MRKHGGRAAAIRAGLRTVMPLSAICLFPVSGNAAESLLPVTLTTPRLVTLVVVLGVVGFAIVSAITLTRARQRAEAETETLRAEVAELKAAVERREALLEDDRERIVAWDAGAAAPMLAGGLSPESGAPADRAAFLAFGRWLKPESAGRLERAIETLRKSGEAFSLTVATANGRLIEARGRTAGSAALVRFRDLSGDALVRAELEARYTLLEAEAEAMRAMFAASPMPIWLRDERRNLLWANAAYVEAVGAASEADVLARGLELIDSAGRGVIETAHRTDPVFVKRLPAVVSGERRIYDVIDVASASGSGGIAIDVTEVERAEAALRREIDFNARTLDQLATAVAIFGPDRRLKSYNAAYRRLFDLDPAFLDTKPDEHAVLDRLRATRRIPEQGDYRGWRAELLSVYRASEAREHTWHLPDGQTLRVIANPNPQGGMTWVYENVTERLELQSKVIALSRVQGETIDHLSEGVAVFGSDGRLRLHNPMLARVLDLDRAQLAGEPHVADIVRACRRPGDDDAVWAAFTACVAGLTDSRSSVSGRLERTGDRFIDYATVPLPDGQTMVTFVDVSDSVRIERALTERAEALEAADALKNAFIHHVSYELRSPLTNIIGFTQLLADASAGPLTEKQREYTGYVMSSSTALLAIVNDILDLATIDAGIMELDYAEVDVAATVAAAIEGVQDRLADADIRIATDIAEGTGSLFADARRVRQVLFNLLVNAISFSPKGGRVELVAHRDGEMIEFVISDSGAGIPRDFIDSVFDRFASRPRGKSRGGAGLGLAIVKSFVELHGGTVEIRSEEGTGSKVIVRLPIRPAITAAAAE